MRVLICSLEISQILTILGWQAAQAANPVACLLAYVTFYDQRGGGSETTFKGDKQGLGLTKRIISIIRGSLASNKN